MLSQAASKDPAMSGQLAYERVDGEFYPTPPEYVDCLTHFVDLSKHVVWEPACGEGDLSMRLLRFCRGVVSTDLYDRGFGTAPIDFLNPDVRLPARLLSIEGTFPAIITNPPYLGDLPEEFIRKALDLTEAHFGIVAMFLRNEYDMSSKDRPDLFEGHPAYAMKICCTKRPRFIKGSKGSPRHNYAWYVWDWTKPHDQLPAIRYIHPSQAK